MPMCFDISELEADVAIVGICMDCGTTYRSGARFGPKAIREGSMPYAMGYSPHHGFYDIERNQHLLAGKKIVDCGDIPTIPTLFIETLDVITQFIQEIRQRGAVPVVLGGDHSISFPVVRAFSDTRLHVIQFDTHLDLMDEVMGIRFSHANPMRRISELKHVTGITQIGIRGLLNQPEWVETASEVSRFFTAEQVRHSGEEFVTSHIPPQENVYISLDIDVLDPSVAPGTGTPEPGGLSYVELRELLRGCVMGRNLVGADIVEVNPLFDSSGRTGQVAARLLIDLLGSATFGSGSVPECG